MNESSLIILLKIINVNGDLKSLRVRGYTYSQIAVILGEALSNRYIEKENEILQLSDSGKDMIRNYDLKKSTYKKHEWILPRKQFYEDPIERDIIILPKRI